MPKVKISEYSTTNANNTDIEGINIDEGCAPSGINNAIRELMVHLKEFQTGASGDPLTVAGAFVASGSATLNGTSIPASATLAAQGSTNTFTANQIISVTDNTNAALRVTQLGTGNALVVEDSTNPDSTPFVVDASGNVGIGTNAPTTKLNVYDSAAVIVSIDGDTATTIRNSQYSTNNSSGSLNYRKARGTLASPTAVASGDFVLSHQSLAYDGAEFRTIAGFSTAVETYTGSDNVSGYIRFNTRPTGAGATSTERMRIRSDGNIAVGDSGSASQNIRLTKPLTGGTTAISFQTVAAVQSDVTTEARYYSTGASTAAASFTLTDLHHFFAFQNALGAGSAVSSQYGFHAASSLTSATNNYGFYSNIASGTGRWNLYANGTAKNYFAGFVGMGTSDPQTKLEINSNLTLTGAAPTYTGSLRFTENPTATNQAGGIEFFTSSFGSGYGWKITSIDSSGVQLTFATRQNSATWTEAMRISSANNVLVGGTAARGTTVGSAHIDLFNGTAPAGTLTNGVSLYSSSGDFNFMDAAGNGYKVGYRNIPAVGTKTGSYTLAVGDVGKYVQVGSGGSITIPDATFAEGDVVSVFNNTSGNITITCSITTAYIAGTDADKASVTLATRGVATILFISGTVCVISGNVS